MARVWVAMSGGVDSSLAAALLVEAGHDVTGVTMRLLDEDTLGGCCPSGSVRDAKRVCDLLGVPHYTLDLRASFARHVVDAFVDAYMAGRTPNPCIECNDRVKFDDLLGRALANGAEALATGHYARVATDGGQPWLLRGADAEKDQSYFLYRCDESALARLLFPVGEMRKDEVRAAAAERGLPTAARTESQEACFLAGERARAFVRSRRPECAQAGDVVDRHGRAIGRHDGAVGFTIGQRRGTGVAQGGPALYVTEVRPDSNEVVVGPPEELLSRTVLARCEAWRGGDGPVRVTAQVRYRSPEAPATAVRTGDVLTVTFDEPVSAVAPGQAVVCWDGIRVCGGGTVEASS